LEAVEERLGVGPGSVANVAPLRVADDRDAGWDQSSRLLQHLESFFAERFVECQVRLVRTDEIRGSLDDRPIECQDTSRSTGDSLRQASDLRVQSYAKDTGVSGSRRAYVFEKAHPNLPPSRRWSRISAESQTRHLK